MNLKTVLTPKQSLNKAYLKEKVTRSNIELFKNNLIQFIDGINEKESEEYVKNLVTKFLYDTYYNGKNQINTKGRIDLAIYEDKKPVVIIEAKRPSSSDMVSVDDLNTKATHELMLYYLQERVDQGNIDIKYLIITNTYEWFVFDASVFDNLFYKSSALMKDFNEWKNGQKARTDRDLFYNDIAKLFLKNLKEEIKFTWFDLRQVAKFAKNDNPKDDSKLIDLFKILSPAHLLKQPFANDSNSLDTKFYSELLHIIGLEEKKEGGKKLIQRKEKPDAGSLLENAINILVAEDRLHKLPKGGADYGDKNEERLFNVALELCITWINRILFLKLLEGQLLTYHTGDKSYRFLDFKTIPNYDELTKLFFQVLARKESERTGPIRDKFTRVPYLNSSLFDVSDLEADTLRINSLDDGLKLRISSSTVLKTENGKKREGELPTLQYLFEFLDAYDFSSEGKEEIQEENKTLINASVLGLIFEKINGYKDGSFFTPGFITMYMCRETIRRAVVQKFNEAKKWKLESFNELHNHIGSRDIEKANEIIDSLKICDPAVGSGHFLVSALNEIIAIKSELGILTDREGKVLRDYAVEVVNDELIVSTGHNEFFEYKPGNKESQRVQEALFHEKQTLIENCLFGVDINPNSVKICRLRLWIELLKNAYYTTESKYKELETLPNIDINIKQGNSLISRFSLDADLSKSLKSIKYSIDDYRAFVNSYKNATDKEEKRGFEKLIEQIKTDFRTEIAKYSDPDKKRLQSLNEKMFQKYQSGQLYELKLTDKQKKDQAKLEEDINTLTEKIKLKISDPIFKDAFEWRIEFPEVLDVKGNFLGFDAIIGNPPYIDIKSLPKVFVDYLFERYKGANNRVNLFSSFIESSLSLIKNEGLLAQIVPTSLSSQSSYKDLREIILSESNILNIVRLPSETFGEHTGDVKVDTMIIIVREGKETIGLTKIIAYGTYNRISAIDIETADSHQTVNQNDWLNFGDFKFSFNLNDKSLSILEKCKENTETLEECADFSLGLTPYDKYRGHTEDQIKNQVFHANHKKDSTFQPLLLGNDVHHYNVAWNGETWISYGDWLGAARQKRFFTDKRIIVKQIIDWSSKKIWAAITDKELYNTQNAFVIIPHKGYLHEYILALLNSNLMSYYHKKTFVDEYKARFQKILIKECKLFPIKKIDAKTQEKFKTQVDKIIDVKNKKHKADTSVIERKIDEMVYQLYGLTEDEIKIVEGN
jgi:adenine-specific DNA-methyltransferase